MSKVSEYRQHSRECRSLANTARFSQHREMLLNMAVAWETLANDRIKTAEGWGELPSSKTRHGRAVSAAKHARRGDRVRDVDAGCDV
jgi:hypothetical protein